MREAALLRIASGVVSQAIVPLHFRSIVIATVGICAVQDGVLEGVVGGVGGFVGRLCCRRGSDDQSGHCCWRLSEDLPREQET